MADNTDIISLLSSDADKAIDQIILDAKRLHLVVNGTGTEQAVTEDGSLIPSIRKALVDGLYFKTPPINWKNGSSVTEFNQLYSFSDVSGNVTWWYAPGATVSNPVVMKDTPINDGRFRVFLDKTNISQIYAPLVSPDFKGNPRVPLPAQGDDSNSIASTQWVQREVQALEEIVNNSSKGEFENITVKNDSVLQDVYIGGEFIVSSDKLSAPQAEATFKRLRVVGTSAEIAFEQNGAAPDAADTKTNIKPYSVSTGNLSGDVVNAGAAQIGDVAVSTDSLNVDGYIRGDYLHLEGNNRNTSDKPQLVVDGIAEIGTLRVTGEIEGLKADVDGLDILPNSVTTTEGLEVGKDAAVAGKLNVAGATKVSDLEVTGSLTGVAINVDKKDIKPSSVSTGNLIATGNVQISGDTTATGKIITQDLQVLGKLTANLDLSGSDLKVDVLDVAKTATVKDLVVTGSTTGVKADVDGQTINPASVNSTGAVSASGISSSGNATVGGDMKVEGDLQVEGIFSPLGINTGSMTGTSLTVTEGVTTVGDLVVTGKTTGLSANVDGTDILPSSVVSSGKVDVGGNLTVSGKTTLSDVEFTGTATGLDVDLSGKDIAAKSIVVTSASSIPALSTTTIDNTEKIVTKDLQVSGDILDAEGNPINTFDVTGKDILPNSVQSATSVRTKTLLVSETSETRGLATFGAGITITGGDISSPQGKATFNDVQVNGSLTDSEGNAIGSAESIKGKDIEPRSVVAEVSVQAPRIQSTGDILGASSVITGDSTAKNLIVGELATLAEAKVSGKTTGADAQFDSLRVKRKAGSEDLSLIVEGDAEIQGDLTVDGTITGIIDLSAQDITMKSLQVTEGVSGKNITASATVTGANGVFGGASSGGAIGLQSLSNAKVAEGLQVGGDLTVSGTINGNLSLSGKDINPAKVTTTDVISTNGRFTNLTVTGTLNVPEQPVNIKDLTCDTVDTGALSASKMSIVPKSDTAASATYTPDGTTNVYNVNVTLDTQVKAPTGLLTGGKAETYFMYIAQDATGHAVTFGDEFFVHGAKVVNPAADSLTICNMVYRGIGNVIDVFIAERT